MDLSEYARTHAAYDEPSVAGDWVGGTVVRALAAVVVIGWTMIAAIGSLGWTAVWRGLGLLMMIRGSGYLSNAAKMWWARLVLHRPLHWTTRPSVSVMISAWAGSALVAATLVRVPGGAHVALDLDNLLSVALLAAFYSTPIALAVVVAGVVRALRSGQSGIQLHIAQQRPSVKGAVPENFPKWALSAGVATGYCRSRNDSRGMYAGDPVALSLPDASRGLLVMGAPGSGKTTLLRRIAQQAESLAATALVAISAKPADAMAIAALFDEAILIGPGHAPFLIFGGLSPEAIGGVFGSLAGDAKNPFWRAAVANLTAAWLQVILGLRGATIVIPEQQANGENRYEPEQVLTITYSPETLADMLYASPRIVEEVMREAVRRLPSLVGSQHANLSAGLRYFAGEYQATLETARGETLGSVRASISPYLRALCAPGFADAFGAGDMDLATAIDAGSKIIIDVDMAESPEGFGVVAALVMAHLKRFALNRTGREPAKNNPCVVLADEFGTYAASDHLALFELCRQAQISSVVSIIGLSNLQARLGEAAAFAIPSALGSAICFAQGDARSRTYVTERIGTVRSREITAGTSSGRHPQMAFVPSNQYSTSEHYVTQPIIDDECWANLGVHGDQGYASAVAIVAQGGQTMHDVIMVPA